MHPHDADPAPQVNDPLAMNVPLADTIGLGEAKGLEVGTA
jgi:hypothetical protein